MAFLSVKSMYLYKFIIPSIDISEATTEKPETAPEHLFGFLYKLFAMGRT